MRVVVHDVSREHGVTVVSFECACGSGRAVWVGDEPGVGEVKFVELEIDGVYQVETALVETDAQPGLSVDGGDTVIVARVVSASDDGSVVLDVCGEAVAIAVSGPPPRPGAVCRLRTRALRAFDCNY